VENECIWWKFDVVITKIYMLVFLRHGVVNDIIIMITVFAVVK